MYLFISRIDKVLERCMHFNLIMNMIYIHCQFNVSQCICRIKHRTGSNNKRSGKNMKHNIHLIPQKGSVDIFEFAGLVFSWLPYNKYYQVGVKSLGLGMVT